MVNLSDFMPYVLPYAIGCSYPLAEQHIRQTCIDFCNIAPVVQVELDPINVVAGQFDYDLEPPSGMAVTFVLSAKYRGNELGVFKSGDSDSLLRSSGTPTAFKQSGDPILTLNFAPIEDVSNSLALVVATKPTNRATSVADILFNDYAYEIGLGAVSRLLKVPGQPFTNQIAASEFRRDYEIARTNARIRAEASFGRVGSTAKYRRFI